MLIVPSTRTNIIAFDFGSKRIGVAATNTAAQKIAGVCTELKPISAREGIPDWNEVGSLLDQWTPAKIIVGLPLDADGGDMEITRRTRKFCNRLRERFGCQIELVDETLSTRAAKAEASARGRSHHYASSPVDSIAARLILESWLRDNQAR